MTCHVVLIFPDKAHYFIGGHYIPQAIAGNEDKLLLAEVQGDKGHIGTWGDCEPLGPCAVGPEVPQGTRQAQERDGVHLSVTVLAQSQLLSLVLPYHSGNPLLAHHYTST